MVYSIEPVIVGLRTRMWDPHVHVVSWATVFWLVLCREWGNGSQQ